MSGFSRGISCMSPRPCFDERRTTVNAQRYTLPEEFRFELSDFITNAWKHRYAVLALILALTGAVTVGAMRLPKVYEAKARLLIDPVLPRVLGENAAVDNFAEQARQEAFYRTQQKIIASRSILTDAAQRLELGMDGGFASGLGLSSDASPRAVQGALSQMLEVQPDSGSRIMNISIESERADLASAIANAIGQSYIDSTLERRLETTRGAAEWLDDQVEIFAGRLESQEARLNDFKQANLLVSVSLEDRQNMISANLAMLNESVMETRAKLIQLRSQRDTIAEALASRTGRTGQADQIDDEIPPPLLDNPVVTSLRVRLADLRRTRAEQSSRYGELHPVMHAVSRQIAETKETLRTEIKATLGNLEAEIDALEQTEGRFEDEIQEEKQRALALNGLGLEYSKLTRDVGTTKETYESLLRRRTETALSGLLESNYVHWFERAETPTTPVSPVISMYVLLGFLASLALALSFVAAVTLLDNTIRGRSELEDLLDLTVLGALPSVALVKDGQQTQSDRDLYVFRNPTSTAAEAARSVRTNLLLLSADATPHTILVTSPRAQEGKTTTALALATSMAQAKNRVLLIDTDLRRPRLHRALSVSSRTGLTNALLREDDGNAIKSTEIPQLDLLPSGPLPPNPAELLHSERLAELIQELKQRYDRIIFDSPPVNLVTDASILSRLVDGCILVVRANATPREAARAATRQLRDIGAPIFGVVLNYSAAGAHGENYYYHYAPQAADHMADEHAG